MYGEYCKKKSTPVKKHQVTWLISLVYSLDLQCFVMLSHVLSIPTSKPDFVRQQCGEYPNDRWFNSSSSMVKRFLYVFVYRFFVLIIRQMPGLGQRLGGLQNLLLKTDGFTQRSTLTFQTCLSPKYASKIWQGLHSTAGSKEDFLSCAWSSKNIPIQI